MKAGDKSLCSGREGDRHRATRGGQNVATRVIVGRNDFEPPM